MTYTYFIKEQSDVLQIETNETEVQLFVLSVSRKKIVNEQVDVSCGSSLFICFMKE